MIEKNERLASLEWLETIAIFFVVAYHTTIYSYNFLYEPTATSYIRYFIRTILSPCVPLFFFVNGYLLLNKPFDFKKHIMRMVKYILLSLVWAVLTLLILMPIKNESMTIGEFFYALRSWKIGWINHLWFLGVLVCIYIVFPMLKLAWDNNRKIFLFFTVIVTLFTVGNKLLNGGATVLMWLLKKNQSFEDLNFFSMYNPFRNYYDYALSYFCIGGYAYVYKDKILSWKTWKRNLIASVAIVISCVGLFIVGVAYSSIYHAMWDIVFGGYGTIFTFINVLSFYVLSLSFKGNKLVSCISKHTLGIYLVHMIFVQLTLSPLYEIESLRCVWFNVIYAIGVFGVSLGVVLLLEKIPYVKKLIS